MYQEVEGNLISLAKLGTFDVIAHGCNCFCTMGAGIAPQMADHFGADEFISEDEFRFRGDINKLGQIEWEGRYQDDWKGEDMNIPHFDIDADYDVIVVNAYTQYGMGKNHATGTAVPLDLDALTLCLRKMNRIFKGRHIGLPQIGCGLAGGIWDYTQVPNDNTSEYINMFYDHSNSKVYDVKTIIQRELKDCDVTVVIYKP